MMNLIGTVQLAVAVLCVVGCARSQHYEAEHESYISHNPESENDAEDSGYVTPLDFLPLFGGEDIGLHAADSNSATDVFTIFPSGQSKSSNFFVGDASVESQFSPQNFGFVPQYSQGLTAESVVQPKTHLPAAAEGTRNLKQKPSAAEVLAPLRKFNFQPDESFLADGQFPQVQSLAGKTKLHRQKRYTNRKKKQKKRKARRDEDEEGEYDYLSDYKSRPKQFDSGRYDSPDFSIFGPNAKIKEFDYGSDVEYGLDEYEKIKSLSEKEAAEASKDPKNCVEVKKESMTCKVCKNPQTGGSYESCSYASEPQNNKYAYVKQQKFDSQDEPAQQVETGEKAELKEQPTTEQTQSAAQAASSPENVETKPKRGSAKYQQDFINIKPQKLVESPKYQTDYSNLKPQKTKLIEPKYSSEYTNIKPQKLVNGPKYQTDYSHVKPQKYRSYYTKPHSIESQPSKPAKYTAYEEKEDEEDDEEEEDDDEEEDEEEEEKDSHSYASVIPDFFTNNEPKKNVEHVLAEFAKKDRSDCTKTLRQGMTCYQCTAKNGLKHEECMFVSESAPKSSHLAYKELKQFNTKPEATSIAPAGNEGAESKVVASSDVAPSTTEAITTTTTIPASTEEPVLKKKQHYKKYIPDENPEKKVSLEDVLTASSYTEITTASSRGEQVIKRHVKRSAEKKDVSNKGTGKELKGKSPESLSSLDRIANPQEFAEETRGAFWSDTVPEYSKELGISLPKYMLEKSQHESFFEDFLSRT